MTQLGNGLVLACLHADALTVQEAELATVRRIGAPETHQLVVQANLANTFRALGREEQATNMLRDVYSGRLKLDGAEDKQTIASAILYARSLLYQRRFEEAKSLLLKTMPATQRTLGTKDLYTLTLTKILAQTLFNDPRATLDELREAVTMLEDIDRIGKRVLGGAHPNTKETERDLRLARAALRAREVPDGVPRTFAKGWLDGPS